MDGGPPLSTQKERGFIFGALVPRQTIVTGHNYLVQDPHRTYKTLVFVYICATYILYLFVG